MARVVMKKESRNIQDFDKFSNLEELSMHAELKGFKQF